jgi:hypothetical protein
VDALLRTECGRIRRSNNNARKRGVVVSDQVEAAETFESWLGVLVSDFPARVELYVGYETMLGLKHRREDNSKTSPMAALSLMVSELRCDST